MGCDLSASRKMTRSANEIQRLLAGALLAGFCGGSALDLRAQTGVASTGTSDYRNIIYDPARSISGVSTGQTASVSLFSGSVGPAGDSRTPTDGTLYLVRSAI